MKSGKYTIGDGLRYTYDKNGNISEVRENGKFMVRYAYDKLNRLVREDNKKLNSTYAFTYDNNGNILNKSKYAFTLSEATSLDESNAVEEKLYTYDGTHGDRLVDFGGQPIGYNALGNPLNYRGNLLEWENGRQLKKFGNVVSEYDGYGKRTKKTVIQSESEGSQTVYTYDNSGKLVKQSDGTNTLEFIYDNSGLSGIKHGSTNYIIRKNVQGDVTHILDMSGNIVVQYTYDAWGNHKVYNPEGTENTSSTFIGNLNPFRYRSYFFDSEASLYFLQTRYYDPETGRFISQDDVSYLDPKTINGLNLYAYCGNNPVMRVDPNGTSFLAILATLLIGTLIGAFVGGISSAADGGSFWAGFVGGAISGFISTVGMAIAVATGGLAGLAIAGISGFIAGFSGNIITQGIRYGFSNLTLDNYIDALISGAFSAGMAMISFGLINGVTRGMGAFNDITKWTPKFIEVLKISAEGLFITTMYSLPFTILQTFFDIGYSGQKKMNNGVANTAKARAY